MHSQFSHARQETKLQEKDVEGIKEQDVLPGYDSAWTCSGTKKGYAGSAVFFPKQAERFIVDGKDESVGGPVSEHASKNIYRIPCLSGCFHKPLDAGSMTA